MNKIVGCVYNRKRVPCDLCELNDKPDECLNWIKRECVHIVTARIYIVTQKR